MIRILSFAIMFVLLSSCNDETNREVDYTPMIKASEEAIFFQDMVNETYKLLVKAERETSLDGGGQTFIENVWVTAEELPGDSIHYIFDFRNYYLDWDFLHKDSTYSVMVTGDFGSEDGEATVMLNGFSINDRTFHGNLTIAFEEVRNSFTVYSLSAQSLHFTDTLSQTHEIDLNQRFMLKKVFGIPGVYNNLWFKTGGEASGVSTQGKSYHYTIQDTIIDSVSCQWASRGVIGLRFSSGDSTYINLIDNDSCSNQYTINIANKYLSQKGL